jgi:hypothetical protein
MPEGLGFATWWDESTFSIDPFLPVALGSVVYLASNKKWVTQKKKKNSLACVPERTIPTELSPLIGEVIAYVVRAKDPYGRVLDFIDRRVIEAEK